MVKKKVSKKRVTKKRVSKPAPSLHSKFVFIGDPSGASNPKVCIFRGYIFPFNGDPVVVDDPAVARKLAGNSHFKAE